MLGRTSQVGVVGNWDNNYLHPPEDDTELSGNGTLFSFTRALVSWQMNEDENKAHL